MERKSFEIEPAAGGWRVIEDGEPVGPYATREAAFEAVIGPISNALKENYEIGLLIRATSDGPAI